MKMIQVKHAAVEAIRYPGQDYKEAVYDAAFLEAKRRGYSHAKAQQVAAATRAKHEADFKSMFGL